jgi:large subunit ribosomal protein L17
MRHRKQDKKFGRSKAHRDALMASLVCNLIERKRIKTTLPKAKEARKLAEQMVTLARKGTLAARRTAIAELRQESKVVELFSKVVPDLAGRASGFTRILRVGPRVSDGSEMAILEWVVLQPVQPAAAEAKDAAAKK